MNYIDINAIESISVLKDAAQRRFMVHVHRMESF